MRKIINQLTGALAVVMQRVVQWLARRYAPEMTADREKLIQMTKHMAMKINYLNDEMQAWRNRALSAEQTLRTSREQMKKAIHEHDTNHGTMIGW